MQSLALSCILGYLLGSIPTAFMIVRWKSNIDIRSMGSGNVGALNSLEVTQSKLIGAGVLMLDALKGILAVELASALFGHSFSVQATAGVAAVVGHNFSIWLRFKGGRGLATGAGVMSVIAWPLILIWGALWVLGYAWTRHVNMGNAIASAAAMIGVLLAPAGVLGAFVYVMVPPGEFRIFVFALFISILSKHVEPVREYFGKSGELQKQH